MLAFRATDSLQEFLTAASNQGDVPSQLRERAARLKNEKVIPWGDLAKLCSSLRSSLPPDADPIQSGPWLHEVCKGAVLDLKAPKPRKKSPELIKRLEELQSKLDNKRYQKMVEGVAREEMAAAEDFSLLPTFRLQAAFGFQVILAMAVFYILGNQAGKALSDQPVVQALAGVLGLAFGLFLEAALWMIRTGQGKVPTPLLRKRRPIKKEPASPEKKNK